MEDRYALELHTPEGYRLCRLSAGAEYACAAFTLTCTEAAETVKLELRAAELIAASSGIGYRLSYSRGLLRSDAVILCMLVIGLVGIVMDRLLTVLFRRLLPWQKVS